MASCGLPAVPALPSKVQQTTLWDSTVKEIKAVINVQYDHHNLNFS